MLSKSSGERAKKEGDYEKGGGGGRCVCVLGCWHEGVLRAPQHTLVEQRIARLIASPEGLGQVITHWAV